MNRYQLKAIEYRGEGVKIISILDTITGQDLDNYQELHGSFTNMLYYIRNKYSIRGTLKVERRNGNITIN